MKSTKADSAIVEVGCLTGDRCATVLDAAEGAHDRSIFLYDLFENDGSHLGYRDHSTDSYMETVQRFSARPNIKVIKGRAPESLDGTLPEKIALAIIDTGVPEVEAMSAAMMLDRIVPGGYLYFNTAYFTMAFQETAEEIAAILEGRDDYSPLFWSPCGDAWTYRLPALS